MMPFVSQVRFFKERDILGFELRDMIKHLHYEFYESGETIFDQGSFGDKFYIVIKGKVQVTVMDKEGLALKQAQDSKLAD